jgi:phasin
MNELGVWRQHRAKRIPSRIPYEIRWSITAFRPVLNRASDEMFSRSAAPGSFAPVAKTCLEETPMNTTPNFEIPGAMREVAQKGIDQARQAFDGFISAARQTIAATQGAAQTADTSTQDMATHSFQAAEQNVRATLDFAQNLTQAKSLQEAMQLQADFARSQLAAVQAQAAELGGIAQSAMKQGAGHAMNAAQSGADQSRMSMEDGDEVGR